MKKLTLFVFVIVMILPPTCLARIISYTCGDRQGVGSPYTWNCVRDDSSGGTASVTYSTRARVFAAEEGWDYNARFGPLKVAIRNNRGHSEDSFMLTRYLPASAPGPHLHSISLMTRVTDVSISADKSTATLEVYYRDYDCRIWTGNKHVLAEKCNKFDGPKYTETR